MPGTEDTAAPDPVIGTVRAALAELTTSYRPQVATDPHWIEELLAPRLRGVVDPEHPLVRAVVAACDTPVLRNLAPGAPAATVAAQLHTELRKLGHGDDVSSLAARAWVAALLPAEPDPLPTAPVPAVPTAAPAATTTMPTAATMPTTAPAPSGPPAPPPGPPPSVAGTPPPTVPPPFSAPNPRPVPVAGIIGGDAGGAGPRRSGGGSRRLVAVLAVIAIAAAGLAALGWLRDPSKDRAGAAEDRVASLENELSSAKSALGDAQKKLTDTTKALDDAKALAASTGTVTRAQLNAATFPEQFTLTGKVAPGSCSLTGDACNVTAIVRSVKVTCATKPCDCTSGKCSVTSELWRSAAAVAYDPATNVFSAKGLLDGDVFRCAGVAQPTNFDFRFKVTKVTFGEGTWKVSGVDAELAEASSAGGECLAGNRTYVLGGPAA